MLAEGYILIVDDELSTLKSVSYLLESQGYNKIIQCPESNNALSILAQKPVHLIILDILMPEKSGLELLPEIIKKYPEIPVIIVTGIDAVETAVSCMKNGAYDYAVKPIAVEHLLFSVSRGLEKYHLMQENQNLHNYFLDKAVENPAAFSKIITVDEKMKTIFKYCEAIRRSPKPVLITGETGTGKDLLANAIHTLSEVEGKLVSVNIAGLDDSIFTDTLFGHKKGAFTGAEYERSGLINSAENGTIFLDEIGDLDHASQVKLLRLLDNGEFYRIGSDIPEYAKTRLILATSKNLDELQEQGVFRRDLYYRLMTHRIEIPPLRDRKNDISILANYFIDKASSELGCPKRKLDTNSLNALLKYHFPGNARELQALIYDSMSRVKGGEASLRLPSFKSGPASGISSPETDFSKLLENLDQLPQMPLVSSILVDEALRRSGDNQSTAAALLGISRQAVNRRIKRAKR